MGIPADEMMRDGTTVLVAFARSLAAAGLPVGPERTATFLKAVSALDVRDRGQVYWAGRMTLTAARDDLPVFDAVFGAYFAGEAPTQRRPPRTMTATQLLMPATDEPGDGEEQRDERSPEVRARATALEVLRHRDMATLTPPERAELNSLLNLLRPGLPRRASRRYAPHHRGPIDPRRTVRAMLAAGGEPGIPVRRHRRAQPRRLVLLIDVSGSMAPYADSLLRFAHVLARRQPAATEVFTIGTRLTRVTRALTLRDPDAALAAAAEAIPDFSGGTRLGEVLAAFNNRWGRRGTARGAVVMLFSDGWERGSADLLAEQIRRLHLLTRMLVWVNPHKGKAGYEPVQSGIVAMLPHVDHFVAGHSLAALAELLEVIRDA